MKPGFTDKQLNDYRADGTLPTTPLYWDCECARHYIKRKDIEPYCYQCWRGHEDQPDSRLEEVIAQVFPAY